MPDLNALLARADESSLAALLGTEIVRLLQRLDTTLAVPSRLRSLISSTHSNIELLRDGEKRRILIDLMYTDEATSLASDLGLDARRPYESLADETFRKGSSIEARLLALFGVVATSPDSTLAIDGKRRILPRYALFAHQRDAVNRCLETLRHSRTKRVLLHMPTGAGKTRTAMHVVASYLNEHEGSCVIWLANSEELCEQAAQEFEKAWDSLGVREVEVGRLWGDSDIDPNSITDGLMVAGLAKIHSRLRSDAKSVQMLADRTGLVVFDEAHQVIAPSYQLVLEVLLSRRTDVQLLGLSATPGRSWDEVHKDEQLANFFDRQKVTLQVQGYESPIDYLVEVGYLASPTFKDLLYDGGREITDRDLSELEQNLDVPRTVLDELGLDEQRCLLIVSAVEDLTTRHRRIIVFAPSVDSANVLAGVLTARGIKSDAVTGNTDLEQRARVLSRFKAADNDVRVLVNFGVLTTGFDAPQTSAAVIARPTKSLVLYSQMAGRALRGILVGGNANAEVISIVDTELPGFRAPHEMFTNWEDVW